MKLEKLSSLKFQTLSDNAMKYIVGGQNTVSAGGGPNSASNDYVRREAGQLDTWVYPLGGGDFSHVYLMHKTTGEVYSLPSPPPPPPPEPEFYMSAEEHFALYGF